MKITNIIKLTKIKVLDKLKWKPTVTWTLVFFNKYFFTWKGIKSIYSLNKRKSKL